MSPPGRRERPRAPRRPPSPAAKSRPRQPVGAPSETKHDSRLDRDWVAELQATSRHGQSDRASALVSKALDSYANQDFVRTASLAEEAKTLALRSSRVRELLGLAYYNAGMWKEAVRELLTYKRLSGRVDENHVIGDCYRALGRPDRALELVAEVKSKVVGPEVWTEAVIVGASAYADKGQIDKALAQTARGELEPKRIEAYHLRLWYVRADLLERAGRSQAARALWARILDEDPDFFDARQRLASSR